MHPDKEFCAICDGVGVLGCNFQSGPLCKPGRKAEPQYIDFDTCAKAAGYVKLEPGQVVVNESTHSLAMHMAAKWAEHVAGNDRGVTFIRTSNMEARDE